MSKCWYCNEKILTGNNPEHIGICDKCYNEMFKCGNNIIGKLMSKITDLEAKLAESEEKCNKQWLEIQAETHQIQMLEQDIKRIKKEYKNLEQQLAEKEQRVAELECKLNEKQRAESGRGWRLENGKVIYYCNLLSDYKVERSLEDVVKDLNQMTKESDNAWEMRTLYQGLKNELAEHNQDKISFCVEQLEKVKRIITIHTKELWTYEGDYISNILCDEIDNQIKQLKEGK